MSNENLISFLQTASVDEQLSSRLQRQVSYDDFQAIAKDRGYDLDDLCAQDARRIVQVVTGHVREELTAEELQTVSAGTGRTSSDVASIRQSVPEDTLEFYEGWPETFYEGWPR